MDAQRDVVLITGAGGYIGRALIERLGTGFDIVGLDRPGVRLPENARPVDVDISSDASVREALDVIRLHHGSHIASVIHLAGYYSFSGEPSPKYEEINVRGTARLLRELQHFDVEQFLFASTMLVHAPCSPGSYINEDSPLGPTWPYPQSKLETENVVRRERGKVPVVIARIAGVYDDLAHSPALANQVQRIYERDIESRFFPGHISHGQSALHLLDLVDFFESAIRQRRQLPPELTVLVGESEPLNYDELQHLLGQLIHGEDWETRQIPKVLAKAGAWIKLAIPGEDFIRPWMIERAEDHYALDISRVAQYLGWRPRRHLRDTLPKIVTALKEDPPRWYRENKLEPPEQVARPP